MPSLTQTRPSSRPAGVARPVRVPSKSVLRLAHKDLLAPADILALQVTAGNQAVNSLFEERAEQGKSPSLAAIPIVEGINDGSVDLFTGTFAVQAPEGGAENERPAEAGALNSNYVIGGDEQPAEAGALNSNYVIGGDEQSGVAAEVAPPAAAAAAGSARRPMEVPSRGKYGSVRPRLSGYAGEFTNGSTELRDKMIPAARAKLRPGESLAQGLMRMAGWSRSDCDKYLTNDSELNGLPLVAKVGKKERQKFELLSEGGRFHQGSLDRPAYDTADKFSVFMKHGYSIYVMSADGQFYAEGHKPGLFHHSSFLAGGAVAGAGEMKIDDGVLKVITNKSGHYQPTADEMIQVFAELESRGVDLSEVEYNHVVSTKEGEPDPNSMKNRWPGKAKAFFDKYKDNPSAAPR